MEPEISIVVPDLAKSKRASLVGSSGSVENYFEAKGANTIENEFEEFTSARTKKLFDGLRDYTSKIETDIASGNTDLLQKESIAFLQKRHDLAIQQEEGNAKFNISCKE
jgi:hypothetical protein